MKIHKIFEERVVIWFVTNISPSNIFQEMLVSEEHMQNHQAFFGCPECEPFN